MIDTLRVIRIASDSLLIDGIIVMYDEKEGFWKSVSGVMLSSNQFTEIYTFLDKERLMYRNRFNRYVDKVIKEIFG